MATLVELARMHTDLGEADLAHLQRLVASWGMLSDLCFSDLLLFAPVTGSGAKRFVVLGQIRPTTNQTLYRDDLVGRVIGEVERAFVAQAWELGEITEGHGPLPTRDEEARLQCIPVRHEGRMLAVLTRESAPSGGRRHGELERVYLETFDRFARMIMGGEFPFDDGAGAQDTPRVGDGVVVLDRHGRVEYASPNAINALHRMGMYSNTRGMRFDELGIEAKSIDEALSSLRPATEEIERHPDVIVQLHCIPLIVSGAPTGATVLMRDVSDLRRRDRMLVTMDATIREVHHRVKNNLQTISSLLRLQARRIEPSPGRAALEDAERRIRSIALVHEILSRETGDQVDFNQIVRLLVRMAEEGVFATEQSVRFRVEGDAGDVPASMATPLGVVLTELLHNAAQHAFPIQSPGAVRWLEEGARVTVNLENDGQKLVVSVADNGVGWPPDFSIDSSDSLGLSIVRSLIESQLSGRLDLSSDHGACVCLQIPIGEPSSQGVTARP